jgi:hypothetical protein
MHHARWHARHLAGCRAGCAIARGRHAEHPAEAGGKRADALPAHAQADAGDRPVRRAQQRRSTLQPPRDQVLVRRFPERATELAAEVRRGQPRLASKVVNGQRFEVARVGQVLCTQKMTAGGQIAHRREYRTDRPATSRRTARPRPDPGLALAWARRRTRPPGGLRLGMICWFISSLQPARIRTARDAPGSPAVGSRSRAASVDETCRTTARRGAGGSTRVMPKPALSPAIYRARRCCLSVDTGGMMRTGRPYVLTFRCHAAGGPETRRRSVER